MNRFLPFIFLLFTAALAFAQEPFRTHSGVSVNGAFGFAVAPAGDVNKDGHPDYVVGNPTANTVAGFASGRVRVYSGIDGAVLHTFEGSTAGAQFGISVDGAGDVDMDTFPDIVIGASFHEVAGLDQGLVEVYSGFDGSLLYSFAGTHFDQQLGRSVSGAGDVNKDGHDDFMAGAPGHDGIVANGGMVRIYSGIDGAILFERQGLDSSAKFGQSVDCAGDVDGDTWPDFIVGAWENETAGFRAGAAFVYSGRTGVILRQFFGIDAGDEMGRAVAAAGDVNSDGRDDLLVGSPGEQRPGTFGAAGSARVFSGLNGALLRSYHADELFDDFGEAVGNAGDLNGDGIPDQIVGSIWNETHGERAGQARIFSGADGTILVTLVGDSDDDFFGAGVAGLGDVNNDGRNDVIVGATDDDRGVNDGGSAFLFSLSGMQVSAPVPGIAGVNNTFDLTGAEPNRPAFLVASYKDSTFVKNSCPFVAFDLGRPATAFREVPNGAGAATYRIRVPNGRQGDTVRVQVYQPFTCGLSNLVIHTWL